MTTKTALQYLFQKSWKYIKRSIHNIQNQVSAFIYILINTTYIEVIKAGKYKGAVSNWGIIFNVPSILSCLLMRNSHFSLSHEIKPQWKQEEKILWSLTRSFIGDSEGTSETCRASVVINNIHHYIGHLIESQ
jgi:hypothetical protein